jgi:phosphatidylserine/phosphatidylglycerophosphate/cardiolipin synthase-like enzyme
MHQTRYYEDYPGSESNNLCDALIAACERGVDVTFVIDISGDDWNGSNGQNEDFGNRLAAAGARVYHDDLNRVTHTKLIVVDGVASVIASVNWSHYSLTNNNEVGAIVWSNHAAAVCWDILAQHAASGTLKSGSPLPESVSSVGDPFAYAAARGYEVLPSETATLLFNSDYCSGLKWLFDGAQRRIDVVQRSADHYRMRPPHAGPLPEGQTEVAMTNALLKELIAADERGVDVVMTLEGNVTFGDGAPPDNPNIDFGLRARSRGIDVYWDPPDAQTHAKMVMVDDSVVVGSTNWTIFAVEGVNNELSVVLRSPEIAAVYRAYIDDLQARGSKFTEEY